MHGHQAIIFFQAQMSFTVDRKVHHSNHKTTPFLFEAGRPGGRVLAHTLRLRKFRSCARISYSAGARARAHVNVHVHGLVYTHTVNVHVYVCAQQHNFFLRGFAPEGKKWWNKCKNHLNEMKGGVGDATRGCHFMKNKGTRRTYTKQITHPYIFVLELTTYNYFLSLYS